MPDTNEAFLKLRMQYRAEQNSKDHFRVACLAINLGEQALKHAPNSPNSGLPEY